MKKILILMLAIAMMALTFVGCGSSSEDTGAESETAPATETAQATDDAATETAGAETEGDGIVIGLSLPTQREDIWVRHEKHIRTAAEELGATVLTQISDNDAAKQQAQCENLLSQGIDVLIVGAHDAQAAATIVEMAHAENVPVVSYDRLILNCDVDVYVSFDNVAVGECMGNWFVENVPTGNIIVLAGDPLDNNAKLFRQGAMNIIQPKIDEGFYTLVLDQNVMDWQAENAMSLAEDALTANDNNIVGIVAPNDSTAGGVIQALAAQGLAGKVPITGQDFELSALQRIFEGTQGMTVFKDTVVEGAAAAKAAIELALGKTPSGLNGETDNGYKKVPSVLAEPKAVTLDNLQEVVENSGLYTWEEVTKK